MSTYTPDEQFYEDERDLNAQQQMDKEEEQYLLTEILRRLAEGLPIKRDQVIALCVGCGIDKRTVL